MAALKNVNADFVKTLVVANQADFTHENTQAYNNDQRMVHPEDGQHEFDGILKTEYCST